MIDSAMLATADNLRDPGVCTPAISVYNGAWQDMLPDDSFQGDCGSIFDCDREAFSFECSFDATNNPDTFHSMATVVLALAKVRFVNLHNNARASNLRVILVEVTVNHTVKVVDDLTRVLTTNSQRDCRAWRLDGPEVQNQ